MRYFSIIVPTFNAANTIERCLNSLKNQTFKNFEIIIADGLSGDQTLDIVNSIRDERINCFSEKDRGVYDAMNKAIERARGKWLLFLGSDDFLYDDSVLDEMYGRLEKTTAQLVYGNVKISGKTSWAKDGEVYRGETTIPNLFWFNICHQCIFYDRKIFSIKKYNLNYPVCADYDFNLYCAAKYEIEYHPVIVSNFTGGGLSTSLKDRCFEQEKWLNIVVYFRTKLLDGEFVKYTGSVRKTIIAFFRKQDIKHSFLSLRIFIYLFVKRMIKTRN